MDRSSIAAVSAALEAWSAEPGSVDVVVMLIVLAGSGETQKSQRIFFFGWVVSKAGRNIKKEKKM